MRGSFVALVAAFLLAPASPVAAQIQPEIAPLVTDNSCGKFALFFPPHRVTPDDTPTVTSCFDALTVALCDKDHPIKGVTCTLDTIQEKDVSVREASIHAYLLKVYLPYARLKRWERKLEAATSNRDIRAKLVDSYNRISERLHELLAAHELLRAFSAELLTGFSFTSVGGQTATAATQSDFSGVDSQETQPTGFVNWETVHFLSDYQHAFVPDFSLGGTVGFRPSLVLVTIPGAQSGTVVGPLATFEPSFVWDTDVATNFKVGGLGEVSPFLKGGQTILTSADVLLGNKGQSTIGTPVDNATGRAEPFVEYGVRLKVFGESLSVLHVDKSSLTPMVSFVGSVRQDWRFKADGLLATFSQPKARLVYGVLIDTLQVIQRGNSNSPISLTIQVDYETSFHRPTSASPMVVPSGTRVFFQGSTDIIKVFQQGK
jgi:hypothetical protein